FFFSSRRRHTRSKRDWSSDVCSSDLISSAVVQKRLILRGIFSIIWGVIITGAVPKHREYEGIMTRSQLITKVANDTGMTSNEVEKVMDCIFGTIGDVLKGGDKVTIAGFGRFEM